MGAEDAAAFGPFVK